MAKMISANKLNRLWRNGVVAKMVAKVKVLKTMEEIEANTDQENVAGAAAVAELSNKLAGQPEWIKDATGKITGYRFGGADTVFPFNTNYRINCTIHLSGPGFNTTKSGYISVVDGKGHRIFLLNFS